MRPPLFSGGNDAFRGILARVIDASMRPPLFSGGNPSIAADAINHGLASMRPPLFSGGNQAFLAEQVAEAVASMRPPLFSGGNIKAGRACDSMRRFNEAAALQRRKLIDNDVAAPCASCFNEAAALQRRKQTLLGRPYHYVQASMRPPLFSGGNFLKGRLLIDALGLQ